MKKLKVNKTILVTGILIGSIALGMTGNTFAYNVKPYDSASLNILKKMLSSLTSAVTSLQKQNVSLANQLTAVKTNLQKSITATTASVTSIKNAESGKIVGTCGPNTVGGVQYETLLTCKAIEVTNYGKCLERKTDGQRWVESRDSYLLHGRGTDLERYDIYALKSFTTAITDMTCRNGQLLIFGGSYRRSGNDKAYDKRYRGLIYAKRVGFKEVYKFE